VVTSHLRGAGSHLVLSTDDSFGLARALSDNLGSSAGLFVLLLRVRQYAAVLAGQGILLSIHGERGLIIEFGRLDVVRPTRPSRHIRLGRAWLRCVPVVVRALSRPSSPRRPR
jgi:hypothetical protein